MTMLSLIQHHLRRTGLPYTTVVYGSTDPQVLQCMALLEEEGNDLAMRHDWQALTLEAEHTSIAAEDQGAISTIAVVNSEVAIPIDEQADAVAFALSSFRHIKNETFWDRTNSLPIVGPLDDKDWQAIKGMTSTGARFHYRIRGGRLLITPTPTAGYRWYFEYVSKNWILGANGTTYKKYFTLDTDTLLLPEELLLAGLRWRWAKEKGLDYAELFRTYETQVKDAIGRDGGKRPLSMDLCTEHTGPAVFVPAGNWAIP